MSEWIANETLYGPDGKVAALPGDRVSDQQVRDCGWQDKVSQAPRERKGKGQRDEDEDLS